MRRIWRRPELENIVEDYEHRAAGRGDSTVQFFFKAKPVTTEKMIGDFTCGLMW